MIKFLKSALNKIFKKKNLRNQMMYFSFCPDNKLITPSDKILIISPHPDDEVIGCGGIISKYFEQIHVLCVNSSGVRYDCDTETAESIAQKRCDEFYNVMRAAGITKSYIVKIWGTPPMFNDIMKNCKNYLNNFDFTQYDYIFVPDIKDGHREHRFVASCLLRKLLKSSGYKKSLKIVYYEVWAAINDVNYFEDITDYALAKSHLIDLYESRKKGEYSKRVLGLNCYRGMIAKCLYAEAFKVVPVYKYLKSCEDKSWKY